VSDESDRTAKAILDRYGSTLPDFALIEGRMVDLRTTIGLNELKRRLADRLDREPTPADRSGE
jgi:hypothetical protein